MIGNTMAVSAMGTASSGIGEIVCDRMADESDSAYIRSVASFLPNIPKVDSGIPDDGIEWARRLSEAVRSGSAADEAVALARIMDASVAAIRLPYREEAIRIRPAAEVDGEMARTAPIGHRVRTFRSRLIVLPPGDEWSRPIVAIDPDTGDIHPGSAAMRDEVGGDANHVHPSVPGCDRADAVMIVTRGLAPVIPMAFIDLSISWGSDMAGTAGHIPRISIASIGGLTR